MPTPHINAADGDFALDVLLPGDPLRARRIAEQHLTDTRLVTDTRGILGYTGQYLGKPLSVMASGMGMPSAAIYATELVRDFGVQRIVRVGTAGGLAPRAGLRDVVIAAGAHTDSAMSLDRIPGVHFSHLATPALLRTALDAADRVPWAGEQRVHAGTVFSTDTFYKEAPLTAAALRAHDVLAVEMEAAALYAIAAQEDVQALAVLTVTDRLEAGAANLSAQERETGFGRALDIALGALFPDTVTG